MEERTLLDLSAHGGCAAKVSPLDLQSILQNLPFSNPPELIAGFDSSEDAGIILATPDFALVQTVDVIAPLVADPFIFGRIAAANALSDVYAKGGVPLSAMNIVLMPPDMLKRDLEQMLLGAQSAYDEARTLLVGGHTVVNPELRFGASITGTIGSADVIRNSTCQTGDVLVLTKPLGVGILATAAKRRVPVDSVSAEESRASMSELNLLASNAAKRSGISACTDVSGFGFLGHLAEMVIGSKVGVKIEFDMIPLFQDVSRLAQSGVYSDLVLRNWEYVETITSFRPADQSELEIRKIILCDPQTSGGLLISVPEENAPTLVRHLSELSILRHSIVGRVTSEGVASIEVV
jgi:selenide,water dikinase